MGEDHVFGVRIMRKNMKKHYHWIVAVVMLLELAVIGGLANNYSGLFILPITGELGITRASFSLAFCLKYLFSFLGTLLSGALFLRWGNKKPLLLGLLLCGAGYALLPLSTNVILLAVGNILLGLGDALCCTAAVSRIVTAWFHRFKGLVWGLVSASTGIGGSIICVLLSGILQKSGWRAAYFTSAIIVAGTLALVLLLVRSRPEDMGLSPYGMGYVPKKQKKVSTDDHWPGYTMPELRKQPAFYLAIISVFLSSFAIYLAYDIIVPHLQDRGLSQNEAVAQQSAMLVYLTASKFLAGLLCDWLDSKYVTVGFTVFGAVSLFLLANVTDPGGATLAIIFYAIGLPLPTVLIPLLTYRLFGYRAQSTYHGIFMSIPQLGLLTAAPIANTVFDTTGSYNPVLLISAGLSASAVILFAVTYVFAARSRKSA